MIVVDTSVLIDSLSGKASTKKLRSLLEKGERMLIPTLVLYEWLRGPRTPEELQAQEALFPSESAVAFGPEEAAQAAKLYRIMKRSRGREIDLAIAACALVRDAEVWTLNPSDFSDVPRLRLTV